MIKRLKNVLYKSDPAYNNNEPYETKRAPCGALEVTTMQT
jgi:hypothetical protein